MTNMTCVVGARPNFVKMAPILAAAAAHGGFRTRLVHTGQHYDEKMSGSFFRDLDLPMPDADLGVGSGSHALQTAQVIAAFDAELDQHPADLVLVVGDVNSTLACALVAAKRGVKIAHVEAGLRSGDWSMPEEVNRVLTDRMSDYLFTTERSAEKNLRAEGISAARICFAGNVMIDTLYRNRERSRKVDIQRRLNLRWKEYAVATLHRPSNVDTREATLRTLAAIRAVAQRLPVFVPLHPRTHARLQSFGLLSDLRDDPRITLSEPLGYLDFLALNDGARLVLTDSGGVQEETTALNVPCLTFRENTERPITLTEGTNRLVGTNPDWVAIVVDEVLAGRYSQARRPEGWDGAAAQRIISRLSQSGTAVGGFELPRREMVVSCH